MRAVLVNVSESLVEELRRLGIEKQDERWQGEWHFVNPPKRWQARLNAEVVLVLAPIGRRLGLDPYGDATGIFVDLELDWRVPDQAYARPEQGIEEGVTRPRSSSNFARQTMRATPSSRFTPLAGCPTS